MPQSHVYRLKFSEGDPPRADIEFHAYDAYKALVMAHDRARHCSAELWRDGHKLCTIRRVDGDVWQVGPASPILESGVH